MLCTLVLAALLSQAPSSDPAYELARSRVRDAVDEIKRDVNEVNAEALERALKQLQDYTPTLAEDPEGLEERKLGYLALAYAYLVLGEDFQAERTMDEALRVAMGTPLPIESFGPRLAELHAARASILEAGGRASVEIDCEVPCRVWVAEHRVADPEEPGELYLGTYRVWIEAIDGSSEPLRVTISLDEDGQRERVRFAAPVSEAEAETEIVPEPTLQPESDAAPSGPMPQPVALPGRRLQPRWAEILGMSVGAGLMVAGALVLGLEGRCPDLSDAMSGCDNIYETNPVAGYTLLGVGGGLLLVEGVMLTVDELRVRKDQTDLHVGLSWGVRF